MRSIVLLAAFGVVIVVAIVVGTASLPSPLFSGADADRERGASLDDRGGATDDGSCAAVRSTAWHPLSGVEYTGRLRLTLPAHSNGALVIYIGDALPLDVEVEPRSGVPVRARVERVPPGPGLHVPPDFWLDDGAPWRAPGEITRVEIAAHDDRSVAVALLLGRRAPRALARLIGYAPNAHATVCAEPVPPGELYFGTGWYGREITAEGEIRWMREHGAILLAGTGQAVTLRIRAAPAGPPDGAHEIMLGGTVNGVFELPALPMRAGFHDYAWDVPDPAWVAGTNEVLLRVSRTVGRGGRTLGVALQRVNVSGAASPVDRQGASGRRGGRGGPSRHHWTLSSVTSKRIVALPGMGPEPAAP